MKPKHQIKVRKDSKNLKTAVCTSLKSTTSILYFWLLKKRINITIGRIRKNIIIKTTAENKSILSETTQVTYNGYHTTFEIPEKLNMSSKNYLPKDTFKMQSIYNQFIIL